MNTILQDIIEHHIWANDTLVSFCEGLTAEQLALTVPGTFGGVEATLVHLAANEENYLKIMDGAGAPNGIRTTIFDGDVPKALGSVGPVFAKTADAWRDVIGRWPENLILDVLWEESVVHLPLSVLVMQVIDHGVEHRTHIRTILATHGLARDVDEGTTEPNVDGWAWNDAQQAAS